MEDIHILDGHMVAAGNTAEGGHLGLNANRVAAENLKVRNSKMEAWDNEAVDIQEGREVAGAFLHGRYPTGLKAVQYTLKRDIPQIQ